MNAYITKSGIKFDQPDYDTTEEFLSSEELLGDCNCPVCGHEKIVMDEVTMDNANSVSVDYVCKHCGSEFNFCYSLDGAYVFKDGRFN